MRHYYQCVFRDGEFDVTIEKMLRKCLQKQTKWVHQLDYATSGERVSESESCMRAHIVFVLLGAEVCVCHVVSHINEIVCPAITSLPVSIMSMASSVLLLPLQ